MTRALLAIALLGQAWAHGPAPAALDALGPLVDGPAVVRTNIGLATRAGPGRYHYVCPVQWGAEEVFPPVVRFGPAIFTAHEGRAYFGDLLGCGFLARRLEGWAGTLAAVVSDGDRAWLVARGPRSQVWTFTGDAVERVDFELQLDDAALAADGELRLVAARPVAVERSLVGDPTPLALAPAPQFLEYRGGAEFLVGPVDGGVALWARTLDGWALRAEGRTAIHGPIRFAGSWLALVDGQIRHGAELAQVGEARDWTCLRTVDDAPVACAARGLVRLDGLAQAPAAVPIFQIEMIQGIQPGCPLDDGLSEACFGQWLHFGGEAGLVGFDAGPEPVDAGLDQGPGGTMGAASADDGCAVEGAPGVWWLALILWFRRRT